MSHKPTQEQAAIRDVFATGDGLTIEAGAGAGKTSTLRMLASDAPRRRGLYLAYNRAIKDDAKATFPANVRALTSHGLAFGPVATRYERAGKRINGARVPARIAAQILRINEPVRLAQDLAPLAPQQLARIALATVNRFCKSGAGRITADHVPGLAGIDDPATVAALAGAIVPYARRAWEDIEDPCGRLRFEHNHYLKIYQLGRPRLRYDYLLVDEAQDLNPCVAALVADQDHMQVVYVGDRCQAINGWNGAVDAMEAAPGKRLFLSQSFRFGHAVAEEANKWMRILRAQLHLRGTDAIASRVGPAEPPDAILCRSNATAMSTVMRAADQRVALVGGGDEMRSLALAAMDLQQGKSTDHPQLLAFSSWAEVREHADRDEAGDLSTMVKLIDTYTAPVIVHTIDRLVPEPEANLVVSTAHKAKGREWGRVRVADDFHEPRPREDGRPGRVSREDAMLAYVTVTRAREVLDREGLSWVDRYAPGAWSDPEPQAAPELPEPAPAEVVEIAPPEPTAMPAGVIPTPHCWRCGGHDCTCGRTEAAVWSARCVLPAGPAADRRAWLDLHAAQYLAAVAAARAGREVAGGVR